MEFSFLRGGNQLRTALSGVVGSYVLPFYRSSELNCECSVQASRSFNSVAVILILAASGFAQCCGTERRVSRTEPTQTQATSI